MSESEDLPQEFGSYTLHELIDRGGMAEIYRATMPGIGGFEKPVAIKRILPSMAEDEEFITMLIDEARIIVNIEHANIAQVYDLGELEGTYYIAMEYVHGIDLDAVISKMEERGETLPLEHAIYISSCICAGLHVAHSKTDEEGEPLNVVHRDMSPHNVLISYGGAVKIIDFGVAKASVKQAKTQMGVIKGKLLYMSPEQAQAQDLDGRADLFAVGICMYKMLTGELPFKGDNEFQIYNNILEKEIPPPKQLNPDIPDELDRIVMKLLRRDRDQRYQDGYSVKEDLDNLLRQLNPGYTENNLSRFVEKYFVGGETEEAEFEETETADTSVTDADVSTEPTLDGSEEDRPESDSAPYEPGDDLEATIDIDSFDVEAIDPETIQDSGNQFASPEEPPDDMGATIEQNVDRDFDARSKRELSGANFGSNSASTADDKASNELFGFELPAELDWEGWSNFKSGSIPPVIYGVFGMIGIIFLLAIYLLFQ